jgi:hypothetical protein
LPSGYIFFNIGVLFLITWLFFGGYKRFIPTKAVAKVMKRGTVDDSDEKGGESEPTAGTNLGSRTDDEAGNQYIEEVNTSAG